MGVTIYIFYDLLYQLAILSKTCFKQKGALFALADFRAPVRMGVSLQVYATVYIEIQYIQITSRCTTVIGKIGQDMLMV